MSTPSRKPSLNSTADEKPVAAPSQGRAIGGAVTRAQLVLYWEQLWPGLLPTLAPLFVLITASLFGLWQIFPASIHWLALAATAGTTVWALRHFIWDIEWPRRRDALARLEDDGQIDHAPLQALEDSPFEGDKDNPFWRAHLNDMSKRARNARLRKPISTVDERDPYSLRFGAIGLLIVALFVAGNERNTRLLEAFNPNTIFRGGVTLADVWIEPPGYTGKATIYLLRAGDEISGIREQINAPIGSTIVAQVNGKRRISLSLQTEEEIFRGTIPEEQSGEATRITLLLPESGIVRFDLANQEGAWPIGVIPDHPPSVTFLQEPTETDDARLSLSVDLDDDYGIANATLEMKLAADQTRPLDAPDFDDRSLDETRTITLDELIGPAGTRNITLDLQSDPWAGLEVTGQLTVKDGAAQEISTKAIQFKLPQRPFFNPLAKAVIEQRQTLAVAAKDWPRAGRSFDALTLSPETFYDNTTDYLLLRSAFWRVMKQNGEGFEEAVEDFWPLALQLEDEALELARRRLEAAEEALRQALENGASDTEIANLVEELREAMKQYLQALAQSGQAAPTGNQSAEQLNQSDLDQMLDAIRDLAQSGAQNAARQALSDLENILNNLSMAQNGQGQQGEGQPGQGQAGQGQAGQGQPGQGGQGQGQSGNTGQAGDLIGRQRDLANRSYQQGQNRGSDAQGLAGEQRNLESDLSNLQDALAERQGAEGNPDPNGTAAQAFDDAAREMRRAEQALESNNFDAANTAMERAIDNLRSGAEALAEQAGEQARQAQGGQQGQQQGQAYDPLGRPIGPNGFGEDVDVPDGAEYQRARDVLNELRRRLSDGERTEDEIEYLERLLERF